MQHQPVKNCIPPTKQHQNTNNNTTRTKGSQQHGQNNSNKI